MTWTKVRLPCRGAEFYQIVAKEPDGDGVRILGGEDAAFTRGEADWLPSLMNAIGSRPTEAVQRLIEWAENAVAKNEDHKPWALPSIVSALRPAEGGGGG